MSAVLTDLEELLQEHVSKDVFERLREINGRTLQAERDPRLVEKFAKHVESCPSCVAAGLCKKALGIFLPAEDVIFLSANPLRDTPDVVELHLRRKTTDELAAIVAADPGNTARYVSTARRLLEERRSVQ